MDESSVFGREDSLAYDSHESSEATRVARLATSDGAQSAPPFPWTGTAGAHLVQPRSAWSRSPSAQSIESQGSMPCVKHLHPCYIAERNAAKLPARGPESTEDEGSTTETTGSRDGAPPEPSAAPKDEDEEVTRFVNEFGFVIDEKERDREELYIRNIDGMQVLRREIKWTNMASNWDKTNSKMRGKLKERCRKGIPAVLRGASWQLLLRSREEMSGPKNAGVYDALRRKKLRDPEVDRVIARDLARTFPTHILFREQDSVGQTLLRNILHAYACIDPEVAYVQGMGFIVGTLTTQMGEEETFWAFHALMTGARYTMREVYRPGFPMLQQFFYQLKRLMARQIPRLYQHFETLGVDPSFYASQWFLTLFVYHFQFRALLRVWDIFMSEGWKIIFRVAIALMKWEEKRLLGMEFDTILPALKTLHEGKNPDEIVTRSLRIKFKTSELNRYGEEYRRQLASSQLQRLQSGS